MQDPLCFPGHLIEEAGWPFLDTPKLIQRHSPQLRVAVLQLGEQDSDQSSPLIAPILGYAEPEPRNEVFAMRLNDHLSTGFHARDEEVSQPLLDGRMQMEFGLLQKNQRRRLSKEAHEEYRKYLAYTHAHCGQIDFAIQ